MEKKRELVGICGTHRSLTKLFRIMKITAFLFFFTLAQVFAIDSYSQATRLTMNLKNATVKDVLFEIEENSEFYFIYSNQLINVNRKVNVKANNQRVEQILDAIFDGENINYSIKDRQIILSPDDINVKSSGALFQQSTKISGKVTSSAGEPLPGVTVLIKGTTQGTVTDGNGNYSIDVKSGTEMLVFSFVGMVSKEVEVGAQTVIDVVLNEDSIGIEEVVAIGYGTVKKSDLTGAVGSVQGDDISDRQTTQISQALQGTMSGVMVTRDNNAPGASATIRIRGITSIGDSEPLIIVDGVPVDNINDINPNDVQDISVLKDAASASIYGARAAAGVILVTTKRAKEGEIALEYNVEYGFEKPTQLPEYVDVVRYLQMANELRWNDNGNTENEYPLYSKDMVDNYHSLNAENPDQYPNTDWVDLVLRDNAPRQSHVLSITAGTKAIRSKATLAYDKTGALYDGRSYERITARFNNDATINKYLSASLDFYFKRTISSEPSIDPMYNMLISAPVYAATWSDGRIAEGKSGNNIYGALKEGGFKDNWYNDIGGKLALDFTPLNGLKFSAVLSPSLGFDKGKNFRKKVEYYSANDPTVYGGTLQWNATTKLTESRNDNYRVTTQFLANYTKSLSLHNINAMAGYENFYAFNEDMGASRDQYELASFPYLNIGPLELRDNSGSASENAYRSWFGRLMYNYQNKYFLQGNIRFDASSRFHKDHRWGSFPSFSAGWVISEESFMKDVSWLSYLKLRGSWGTLGNERILRWNGSKWVPNYYPYQATISFADALFFQGPSVVSSQTAAQTQYVIQDISWETTESTDFGLDAYFLDNRLRFSGDYFMKTTKDMLLALEIPDYIGFDNPDQNTGKMETKGWEAEIGWNDRAGDFGYSVSFNISDYKSIMGDLGGTEFLGDQVKFEGSEFNEWYGYLSDGLFQTQEELDAAPKLNSSMKVGDVKYKDISGPDGVPDGKISPEYDKVLLGGSLPRYLFGGNVRLDYKNFDLSIVVQGVGKVNERLEGLMIQPLMENWGNIPKILDGATWSQYNTDEQNLKAKYPRLSQNNRNNNYTMSDFWLINGAYLRLKNVTLGYNIPSSITQKVNLQNVRVYGSVSDFLTINNYPKGWDPEVSASGYPITASFIFGLSVKF